MNPSEVRHAGLIARYDARGWRGVLIEGPSGAGKSELAFRAMAEGFRLVADDRVVVWPTAGRLFGRAPDTLAGLIELRGVGVVTETPLQFCELALVARHGQAERVPEPAFAEIFGVRIPLFNLDLAGPTAAARLGRALSVFDADNKRGI